MVTDSGDPAEDSRRAPAAVFSVLVCPVALGVVALQPALVLFDQLLPAPRLCEVKARHPALDIEGRLDEALPGLTSLYLFFLYAEGFVDGGGLPGTEDASSVGDEPLGRTVAFYGCVEHGEVGVGVL